MRSKNAIATILLLLISTISQGQQLTVESFKLVSENASSTENVEKDINDTPCAILKIKTTERGLKVGGNVIGRALTNGTEYIANVATGSKKITIVGKGTYPLTVCFSDFGINTLKSNCSYEIVLNKNIISNEVSGKIYGHEYVDMGTSVKWATYNIGASRIDQQGVFYRYGETEPYDKTRPYTFMNKEKNDQIIKISSQNDVAHVKWGGSWRMPTKQEFDELMRKCYHIWTIRNGVHGLLFFAENDNILFLPSMKYVNDNESECINYWTSDGFDNFALDFKFSEPLLWGISASYGRISPDAGLYVRAVSDIPQEPELWQNDYSVKPDGYRNGYGYVDLGLSVKWATTNVGTKLSTELGSFCCWGENTQCSNTYWWHYDNNYKYDGKKDVKYGIRGVDQLLLEDDIASQERQSSWRIPTKNEMEELIEKCTWTWTFNYKNSGVNGYIIASNIKGYTDKSIFIPQTDIPQTDSDFSYYWSSNRTRKPKGNNEITEAYCICFNEFHHHLIEKLRSVPLYVRPVCK